MSKESNTFCPKFIHKCMWKLQPILVEHTFFGRIDPSSVLKGFIKANSWRLY